MKTAHVGRMVRREIGLDGVRIGFRRRRRAHLRGVRVKESVQHHNVGGSVKKYSAGIAAAFLLAASQSAQATSIRVSAEAPGIVLPSVPLIAVLTFDDLPVGSLPSYQFRGGTSSGSGAVEDASVVDKYAQPAGDATSFLTVAYPSASGAVQLLFTNNENYFGLYWGSMDRYNLVTFVKKQSRSVRHRRVHGPPPIYFSVPYIGYGPPRQCTRAPHHRYFCCY